MTEAILPGVMTVEILIEIILDMCNKFDFKNKLFESQPFCTVKPILVQKP